MRLNPHTVTTYFAKFICDDYSLHMRLFSLILIFCFTPTAYGLDEIDLQNASANNNFPKNYIPAKSIRENASRVYLKLRSRAAVVFDERDNEIIMERNPQQVLPVASLSKLMTGMVILDANLDMNEVIKISKADKDRLRYSRSRLKQGMKFKRKDLLLIALAASENRAASALARTYPGGKTEFVKAMNQKAKKLGLTKTKFADPAGLNNANVSTAKELMKIVQAAGTYPKIREFTTLTKESIIEQKRGRKIKFINTNRLVSRKSWPIRLSKTGFTSDAGNCLVMQTKISDRPVIIVLLESWGKLSKYGDSNRIKKWLMKTERLVKKEKAKNKINVSSR